MKRKSLPADEVFLTSEGAAVGHTWRHVGAYAQGPDTQLGLVHKLLGHDRTRFIVESREKGRYTATSMVGS